VYDRERRLRFVLVGKMDINGDGIDDTEQLKALIQEFGGKVDPALTVQTDYLVVGEEPTVPSAPAAADSPMVKQMYDEARKRFIEYTEARARAENFSIPILNLNRFLGLVGIAGQV
jgi:BRCT domain type II-containing protein